MQPPKDKVRVVTFDQDAHQSIAKGVATMRKAVGATYGPGGRNVLIKKQYVHPVLTRDGVTVARDIAGHGNRLDDPIATEAAKLVYQASEKTNRTAGDGTTCTVVLLDEIYKRGRQAIIAGEDAMVIKRRLDAARDSIVEYVKSKAVDVDKDKLDQVATIACGDSELGMAISDLVFDVGTDGSIAIEYQNPPMVDIEKVDGYLFAQGFRGLVISEVLLAGAAVFVTQKRMATQEDIVPILEAATQAGRQFVIVGDVSGDALNTLLWAIQNKKADGLVIPPPAYGADGHEYFVDIALYCGAQLWLESDDFKNVKIEHFGSVAKAHITRDKATLFSNNANKEHVDARIADIRNEIDAPDMTPSRKEALDNRLAKLAGKVSIIKVGASTEVEREELFFRVEDAVESCRSALSNGVVAGGATTLLFAGDLFSSVDPLVREAIKAPFKLLMSNAAEDAGYRLQQVLNAGYGKGFNLRSMTAEPIDLLEGETLVVDPAKVIVQVVENAFSVAGALLTTGAIVTEEEHETPATVPAA